MWKLILISLLILSGCTQYVYIGGDDRIVQYHREAYIDTPSADTWHNITWDTIILEETTNNSYFLSNNNNSISTNFSGVVSYAGKITIKSNATNNKYMKLTARICVDGQENACTQLSNTNAREPNSFTTLAISGTGRVEVGSQICLQYRVDDDDLDIAGDPVFDNPVAVSLNLKKISD
jgi:hypothetical protein